MVFGLERNVFHRRTAGGAATLDNHPALKLHKSRRTGCRPRCAGEIRLRGDLPDYTVPVGSTPGRGAVEIAVGVKYNVAEWYSPVTAAGKVVE